MRYLREQFFRLVVGVEVIVAAGKTQSGLVDLRDDHRRIVIVLLAAEAEERRVRLIVAALPCAGIKMVQVRDFERDVFLGFHRRDAVQFRLEWLHSGSVDAGFVHAGGPVVADLLLHSAAARIVLAGCLQRFAKNVFVPDLQATARAPENLVGGHGIRRQPFVARSICRSRAGIERLVDEIGIEVLDFRFFAWISARTSRAGEVGCCLGQCGLGKSSRDGERHQQAQREREMDIGSS